MTWHASVLTLFPNMFPGPLGLSLPARRCVRGVGLWTPSTSAALPRIGIAAWTIRPAVAAPAWCCGPT